jgi:hypothetical protein
LDLYNLFLNWGKAKVGINLFGTARALTQIESLYKAGPNTTKANILVPVLYLTRKDFYISQQGKGNHFVNHKTSLAITAKYTV